MHRTSYSLCAFYFTDGEIGETDKEEMTARVINASTGEHTRRKQESWGLGWGVTYLECSDVGARL